MPWASQELHGYLNRTPLRAILVRTDPSLRVIDGLRIMSQPPLILADAASVSSDAPPSLTKGGGLVALVIALMISLALNLSLGWRIHTLKLAASGAGPTKNSAGLIIQSIHAKDLQGNPATISLSPSDLPTVIFILRSTCVWCAKNMANTKALIAARGAQFHFVGLLLHDKGPSEYVRSNSLAIPIYTDPDQSEIAKLALGATPETIVVDVHGKVLYDWLGAYQDSVQKEVQAYFHTVLPGLLQ